MISAQPRNVNYKDDLQSSFSCNTYWRCAINTKSFSTQGICFPLISYSKNKHIQAHGGETGSKCKIARKEICISNTLVITDVKRNFVERFQWNAMQRDAWSVRFYSVFNYARGTVRTRRSPLKFYVIWLRGTAHGTLRVFYCVWQRISKRACPARRFLTLKVHFAPIVAHIC